MKRNLARLSERVYDVVIVGGGIYGVCVAWEAALRGLSVGLVDKGDFGHATSSNSLRVIHGGLRYLQHGDICRMRRSIYERGVFMRIAPHLVHPLPFLIPTYGHLMRGKEILSLALLMNDLISFDRNRLEDPQKHVPRGRVISRAECLRLFPGVQEEGLTGGAIVHDCQMSSSERLILSFVRSAAGAGAEIANYVEVTGFLEERSRVVGIKAKDLLTGHELDVRARVVVNTTGPWLDQVSGLLNSRRPNRSLMLSKAFNLLIGRQLIPEYAVGVYSKGRLNDRDAILRKKSRLFFITPWYGRSLIGTAHLPYDADPDSFRVTEEEIEAFIDEINEAYPAAGLKRQDVCFAYGGLLPMARNSDGTCDVQLVKQHRIHDYRKYGIDGLVSVIGVKFTEARHVAEKTVDLVFRKLGKTPPKSATAITPLHGAQVERFNDFLSEEPQKWPGLSASMVRHLISQYGSAYREIFKYFDSHPESIQPVTETSPVIKAEVLHATQEEMAQKLTDVVFRRTNLGTIGHPGEACLRSCAGIMSKELRWDEVRTQSELEETRAIFGFQS